MILFTSHYSLFHIETELRRCKTRMQVSLAAKKPVLGVLQTAKMQVSCGL